MTTDFTPVAVKLDDVGYTVIERPGTNEADKVDTSDPDWLKGSGPLEVSFYKENSSPAGIYPEWNVLRGADSATIRTETSDEFKYTFKNPLENENLPDYIVTFTITSDAMCTDSASINIKLLESHLAIPNVFIIGFGATLDYRADYKSLKTGSFKGYIYSRNGRRVHQWTDPSKGWDGKRGNRYVAPGAYVVVLLAEGTDGVKYKIRQTLTIIKEK